MYATDSLKLYVARELPDFAKYFGVIGVIFTFPQISKVWFTHNDFASGVSLTAWLAYTVLNCLWVYYGSTRNDKPIIVSNTLAALANGAVTVGVVFHHGLTY